MLPVNYIMHIPKTAGLSLQGLVRRRYKSPGSLELVYTHEEVENGFEDRPELITVMGHYRFGYHKYSKRPFRYFTFLRDPVQHVISHYQYTKDHPEKFEFLPEGIKNIVDFARCPYGYNLQTRFISGIDNINGREYDALVAARTNLLRHFECIGITEQFDLSLLMLGKALNWKIMYYVRENTGVSKQKNAPPTEAELAELQEILKTDIDLYKFSIELFEKQKLTHPELISRLKSFQWKNRLFQKLNPQYIKLKRLIGKNQ